jgi:hypothetical protein
MKMEAAGAAFDAYRAGRSVANEMAEAEAEPEAEPVPAAEGGGPAAEGEPEAEPGAAVDAAVKAKEADMEAKAAAAAPKMMNGARRTPAPPPALATAHSIVGVTSKAAW